MDKRGLRTARSLANTALHHMVPYVRDFPTASHIKRNLRMTALRRDRTSRTVLAPSAFRPYATIVVRCASDRPRPVAARQDRPYEPAVSARKESSAEAVGCDNSGHSSAAVLDPALALLLARSAQPDVFQ